MTRHTLLFLVTVLLAGRAAAQTQSEMNAQVCEAYAESDDDLNRVYRRVTARLRDEPRRASALRVAQRTWVRYRDQHVMSLCPDPSECGSIWPMVRCLALQHVTEQRTATLDLVLS